MFYYVSSRNMTVVRVPTLLMFTGHGNTSKLVSYLTKIINT